MATANDLPDEIFLEILEYLPCLDLENFNLPTILSLSLTNRRLHYLVEPLLYATYNSFFCTPYLFLRTCVNDRNIAERVQSLSFKYGNAVHENRRKYIPTISDRREIKVALNSISIPGWKAWATSLNDENVEQEMVYAAILMHTPNIKSLEVDDGDVPYDNPKWLDLIRYVVSGSPFGRMHVFTHLKSVKIDVGWLTLNQLIPLFRLFSLRNLTIISFFDTNDTSSRGFSKGSLVPAGSSHIQSLLVLKSYVEPLSLSMMLNSCRSLKEFTYKHYNDGTYVTDCLHYPKITAALRRHQHSLEILELAREFDDEGPTSKQTGTLGSLQEFTAIKHLTSSFATIFGIDGDSHGSLVESLPPILESLHLTMDWDIHYRHYLPALENMASYCRTHGTRLEIIDIGFYIKAPVSIMLSIRNHVQKPFHEIGVIFRISHTGDSDTESNSSHSTEESETTSESGLSDSSN